MASLKMSVAEKKELDKFTRFLALKAAQIIVQSRLGDKIQTQSKKFTNGCDWFNLAVQDLPEVLAETKQAISNELGSTRLPLCVEISLLAKGGHTMILETWCLSAFHEHYDPSNRPVYTVYNRIGILLKSLVSVTRVTPAYKLSRRQSAESYVICYRIYMGEAQLNNLGDGFKQVRVGQICTPVGAIQLSVAYRTEMSLSETETGTNNSIMLKSDHFKPETDLKNLKNQEENNLDIMSRPLKRAAFIDPEEVKYPPIEPKPFEKLFEKPSMPDVPEMPLPKPVPKPLSLQVSKQKEPTFQEMRPLKMAFTQSDQGEWTKVSHLYWYFKDAPSLESFENGPTIGEQDLVGEIEKHQKQLPTYNALVKQLLKSSKDEDDTTDDETDDKNSKIKKERTQCQSCSDDKENVEVHNGQNGISHKEHAPEKINRDKNENSAETHLPNSDKLHDNCVANNDKANNNHN